MDLPGFLYAQVEKFLHFKYNRGKKKGYTGSAGKWKRIST